MEYSRKIVQHDNVEFFWNMEYSWNIPKKYYNKQNFPFFGIWNILEYSKKNYHNQKCRFNNSFLSFNNYTFVILRNMEYSEMLPQQDTFSIFGKWNPKITGTRKILKSVEYGLFAEYS